MPEESFDRLTRLASTTLGVPLAFVTVSDDWRSFWKAAGGVSPAGRAGRQQPVTEALCALVVEAGAPVVVPDIALDNRTRANSLALALGIASWVAYPVHSPDRKIVGIFSVAETLPQAWSSRDLTVPEALSEILTGTIALRGGPRVRHGSGSNPSTEPAFAHAFDLPGLDISARYRPAGDGAEMIGDFFDVFRAGPDALGVVLGDVAGKGVEPTWRCGCAAATNSTETTGSARSSHSSTGGSGETRAPSS